MLRSYENYIHINIIVWDKLAFAVVSVQLVFGGSESEDSIQKANSR